MRPRATLILAALVALLGIVVWHGSPPSDDPGSAAHDAAARPTPPGRLVLDIERDAVLEVILSRGEVRVARQRQLGKWQDEVTTRIMEALLDDLSGLRTLDEIPSATADLAAYGLQPAQGAIEVRLRHRDTPLLVHIGTHNPSTTAVYIRFDDSGPVYLAGSLIAWKLDTVLKQLAPARALG